jgi:hypothetical protein
MQTNYNLGPFPDSSYLTGKLAKANPWGRALVGKTAPYEVYTSNGEGFTNQALVSEAGNSAKIYKSSLGPISALSTTGASCAVGFGGNIAALSNAGVPWVYNGTAKTWTKYAAVSGISSAVRAMFVCSRGFIHLCPQGGGKVYRSTDGGQSYSPTYTWTYATEDTLTFTEDDAGTLWTFAYAYPTKSVQLIKSTDGGATWTEVSSTVRVSVNGVDAGTLQATINRHIHDVYWCKYRNLLFITHGDAGSRSPVYVSADRGASFQAWGSLTLSNNSAGSKQPTVLFTDEKAIYYRADVGLSSIDSADDLGIYRAAHSPASGISALLATAPVKVWTEAFHPTSGRSRDGWSSNGGRTQDGLLWFSTNQALNYSGNVIASVDGVNWSVIYSTIAATGGAVGNFAASRASVSEYYTGAKDKLSYGSASDESICAFAVIPGKSTPYTYALASPQWLPTSLEVSRLYVDYETAPTPTSVGTDTGNAVDNANTTGPAGQGVFSLTKCARYLFTGTGSYSNSQWNNLLNGYAVGSELIIESRVYIEAASLSGNLVIFTFGGGTGSLYIGCNSTRQVRLTNAGITEWAGLVSSSKETLIPLNKWFWLRAIVKTGTTNGQVTVLIDGQVAFRAVGLRTVGSDLFQVNAGAAISAWTGTLWLDQTSASVIPAAVAPVRVDASV